MIILNIGLFLLILSIGMGANSLVRKGKFGLMSSNDQEQYRSISKKSKDERTEEEQAFCLENQEAYYSIKVASISFKVGVVLIVIVLLINFITK